MKEQKAKKKLNHGGKFFFRLFLFFCIASACLFLFRTVQNKSHLSFAESLRAAVVSFSISPASPVVSTVSPTSITKGNTVVVSVTGDSFISGLDPVEKVILVPSGGGATVYTASVTVTDEQNLTASINTTTVPAGVYDFKVVNQFEGSDIVSSTSVVLTITGSNASTPVAVVESARVAANGSLLPIAGNGGIVASTTSQKTASVDIGTLTPSFPDLGPLKNQGGGGGPLCVIISGQGTTTLARGSRGPEVELLQRQLTAEGIYKAPITGNFLDITCSAVLAYQKKYSMPQTGVIDALTKTRLAKNATARQEVVEKKPSGVVTPAAQAIPSFLGTIGQRVLSLWERIFLFVRKLLGL